MFALTHNYTGYPMVKEAREMVRKGESPLMCRSESVGHIPLAMFARSMLSLDEGHDGVSVESAPPSKM